MEDKHMHLRDDEIIFLDHPENFLRKSLNMPRTFRVDDFKERVKRQSLPAALFEDIECEVMRMGSPAWQKGRVRIEFVFIPDEAEPSMQDSPLDDLRNSVVE